MGRKKERTKHRMLVINYDCAQWGISPEGLNGFWLLFPIFLSCFECNIWTAGTSFTKDFIETHPAQYYNRCRWQRICIVLLPGFDNISKYITNLNRSRQLAPQVFPAIQ